MNNRQREGEKNAERQYLLLKATLAGVLFGACFPIAAFFLRSNPEHLFLIICTAPVVLGAFSYLLGLANRNAVEARMRAEQLFQNVALQKELHQERAKSTQNAKLATLGEMSAGIAHEVNNPLGLITGTIPLLEKFKDDPAKFEAKIAVISRASDRIHRIVKGLKKFSRSSEGVAHKDEALKAIVDDALIMVEAKSRRHSTPIKANVGDGLILHCDEVELEQVVVNLVNNAIDAVKNSSERWVNIEGTEENGEIVLRIIDSGHGISNEIEEKLFQPFFTTKPVGEGTGLGLSIVKGILERHGAEISINRSHPNTCFEIRFPGVKERQDAA